MPDLLEVLDIASHAGPGCAHARAGRIDAVYAKWLDTPEAQAAFKLLASMMGCACVDVKTAEEYDAVVAAAVKDPKVAAPVAFTAAEAVKLATVKGV